MYISKFIVPITVFGVILQGCASTGSGGTSSAMDRAVQKCTFSVVGGAILGAIIGSQLGHNNAGGGALAGGALGAGACAVFVKLANDEDRARISELEHQAVVDNRSGNDSFIAKDGAQVEMQTRVRDVPVSSTSSDTGVKYTACRYSEKTLTVQGQSADVEPQLWCRLETGDWTPVAQ